MNQHETDTVYLAKPPPPKLADIFERQLLKKAFPHLIMNKLLGISGIVKTKRPWVKRLCSLRGFKLFQKLMEPVFFVEELQYRPLPKGSGKIRFRRYGAFPAQVSLSGNDGKLPYTEKDIEA